MQCVLSPCRSTASSPAVAATATASGSASASVAASLPAPASAPASAAGTAIMLAPGAAAAGARSVDAGEVGGTWPAGMLLALIVLAAVAWLARGRVARLTKRANDRRSVRLVETTRLSEHARLSVIHFKGRELLVVHGPRAAALLVDLPLDDAAPAP